MASKKSGKTELAARYAVALYELASENKAVDQVADDLVALKRLLADSRDLKRLVRSPAITRQDQFKALDAVMLQAGLADLTRRFVGVVTYNRRLFALDAIIEAFETELADRRGDIRVDIKAARPLSDTQTRSLEESLRERLGARVKTAITIDPGLLGGMVLRVGSRMIDYSLKSKIDRLQIAMKSPGGAL